MWQARDSRVGSIDPPDRGGSVARPADVVKSDWLAGVQRSVARVELDQHGQLDVQPDVIRDRLADAFAGMTPSEAMQHLHERLDGSYWSATTPHGDEECPFHDGATVAITAVEQRSPVGSGH